MAIQNPQKSEAQINIPPQPLMQMISGYWPEQCLYVVSKLGIADLLKDGSQTSEALAQELGMHPRGLYRLLRALASVGVFTEASGHLFSLTPMGQFLRADHPASVRSLSIMLGEEHYQAWGALMEGIKTNESVFEHVFKTQTFDYFKVHPEASEVFNDAMTMFSRQSAPVTQCYDFSQFKTLVDIAGGHGTLLAIILKAYPALQGILYDLPHVVAGAPSVLQPLGVAERCQTIGGDFFQSVPEGADAYILSHIIHDWDDEHAVKILKNIHQAMAPTGKLLLLEHVVGAPNTTPFTTFMDLNMLVMTHGGCERTEEEFRVLLEQAGFRLTRLVPLPPLERYIVEAVKL